MISLRHCNSQIFTSAGFNHQWPEQFLLPLKHFQIKTCAKLGPLEERSFCAVG
jgi:hypothetical protein